MCSGEDAFSAAPAFVGAAVFLLLGVLVSSVNCAYKSTPVFTSIRYVIGCLFSVYFPT